MSRRNVNYLDCRQREKQVVVVDNLVARLDDWDGLASHSNEYSSFSFIYSILNILAH